MVPILISALVGIIWGVTNILMKYASPRKTPVMFLLNQSGSLLFFINLKDASLSSNVPLSNSVSLISAALTAHLYGEKMGLQGWLGMALVTIGLLICHMNPE